MTELYERIDIYDRHAQFPGALSADLAQFYNGLSLEDVWSGKVRPGHVVRLVEHLHLIPESRVRMIGLGGDVRLIGWDAKAELLADQFDQLTAIVSGMSGSSAEPQKYPRPGRQQPRNEESDLFAPSLEDFDPASFLKVLAGH